MSTDEQPQEAGTPQAAPSTRLRTWLIADTILAALGCVAGIPALLFATGMTAFAADDPHTSPDSVWKLMVDVWSVGGVFYVLLIAGVAGGWIAYRKHRDRLSFGLSLLAAAPIVLVVVALTGLTLVTTIWTMALQR